MNRYNLFQFSIKNSMNNLLHLLIYIFFLFLLIFPDYSDAKEKVKGNPSIEACKYVISRANKGELGKISIPSEPWDSPKIKEPKDIPGFAAIVFRKLLDINNDGVLERVFVLSEGTADYKEFSVYELTDDNGIGIKTSPDDNWESDNLRWSADRAFIEFRGITYVLGKTNQSLNYLAYISSKNEMKIVCEFEQKEEPLQRLKTSQNDNVCKLALEGNIEYVEFNKLHSVSH
ncbi:MAG: hypothetical protein C4550_07160, partial [Nitrospiraceae bacterium]